MLSNEAIRDIAEKAAKSSLGARHILRAEVGPATDSQGRAAIGITLVVKPSVRKPLLAGKSGDTLMLVLDQLEAIGDDRWPIISYATEEDLALSADSES